MGDPNGEMDWMTLPWTDDINAYVEHLTDTVDTIVIGQNFDLLNGESYGLTMILSGEG